MAAVSGARAGGLRVFRDAALRATVVRGTGGNTGVDTTESNAAAKDVLGVAAGGMIAGDDGTGRRADGLRPVGRAAAERGTGGGVARLGAGDDGGGIGAKIGGGGSVLKIIGARAP